MNTTNPDCFFKDNRNFESFHRDNEKLTHKLILYLKLKKIKNSKNYFFFFSVERDCEYSEN
jgi:hypothetical protein